ADELHGDCDTGRHRNGRGAADRSRTVGVDASGGRRHGDSRSACETTAGQWKRISRTPVTRREPVMKLYGFFRSGTSHRLRIALNLKGLTYEQVAVDLRKEAQLG